MQERCLGLLLNNETNGYEYILKKSERPSAEVK